VPVAGHRSTRKAVQEMADNKRLEVWLAQVGDMPVLVPFRILIGTEMGDLIIYATASPPTHRNATPWPSEAARLALFPVIHSLDDCCRA